MKEPVVSVIIPTYNREKLILKALDSVFNQTFRDYEILIIDDASTDKTEMIIRNLNHKQIRYFRLDKNGGQCIARNYGIKKAKGEYIAFLDSDDEWLPDKLQKQIECFHDGSDKLGCVYGYAYQKDVIKDETRLVSENFYRGNIYHRLLEGFCPPTPSLFMVRKEALQKVNGFDENLITFVDLDLWLRISKYYDFDYIQEPLIIKYEQIGDQYINNFDKRYKGYYIFTKKWRAEIINIAGKKGLLRFNRHLVYALVSPILDHPPKNLQKNIMKLIGLLIKIRSKRSRYYIKSLSILIFGPNIIYKLRKKLNKSS